MVWEESKKEYFKEYYQKNKERLYARKKELRAIKKLEKQAKENNNDAMVNFLQNYEGIHDIISRIQTQKNI